jgi:hypothetical protein
MRYAGSGRRRQTWLNSGTGIRRNYMRAFCGGGAEEEREMFNAGEGGLWGEGTEESCVGRKNIIIFVLNISFTLH